MFELTIRPGVADGVGSGRARLDAIARWLQDVAYLDLVDAGFEGRGVWVVRRARMRVERFPQFGDELVVSTFCSGIGRFSAERRTTVRGESALRRGGRRSGSGSTPRACARRASHPSSTTIYGTSARGREAKVRLRHPDPPANARSGPWSFRASDVDVAGHVNNSHYWGAIEEELAGGEPEAFDGEIEYRDPGQPGVAEILADGPRRWIRAADSRILASIELA